MKCKLALIGDVHLRRTQYGNPDRQRQITNSLLSIIDTAWHHDCDAILCAGDLLDSNTPGVEIVANIIPTIDAKLRKYNMPMYTIKGNHDNSNPSWYGILRNGRLADHKDEEKPNLNATTGIIPINRTVQGLSPSELTLIGFDYTHPGYMKEYCELKDVFELTDIVMFHDELLDITKYPTETAVSSSDFPLQDTRTKLVLIGHTHIQAVIKQQYENDSLGINERVFISPGSVDYISSSEMDEPKQLIIVTFEDGKLRDIEYVAYDHTIARGCGIYKEEDVDKIIQKLQKFDKEVVKRNGMLIYVAYDSRLKNSIAELKRRIVAIDDDYARVITVVPKAIITDTQELDLSNARNIKEGPVEFFTKNSNKFFSAPKESDFLSLCVAILDPKSDAKAALDTYIETKTSITIL